MYYEKKDNNLRMEELQYKISAIVPMFNVDKYLITCVESIERQTLKDIEIILIDDGSKDNTLLVAKKLAAQYSNIVVLHQSNKGQAAARNAGLKVATGKYISFIDSDDYIEPDMYEKMFRKAERYKLDIIECCYNDVYDNGKKSGKAYYINADKRKVYTGKEFYELKISLSPCDKLYRHDYLKKIMFSCTEGHYAEDVYDTSNAVLNAKRVMHMNVVFYHYRRDNMGSTRNNTDIERRIKLGKDKLYIANQMNSLRKKKGLEGYIKLIIVRNVIGVKLCPIFFKNIRYRKEISKEYNIYNGNKIVIENIDIRIVLELLFVGVKKIIKKGD